MKQETSQFINYYHPSRYLVQYLEKELLNVESTPTEQSAAATDKEKRVSKKVKGQIAKNKTDAISKIFQNFVDLVYFLEFIEDHPELHDLYENDLKDLFGISNDDSSPQPGHYKNRSNSLFVRFISSSFFNNYGFSKEFDFRTVLIYITIFQAIQGMQDRLIKDTDEFQLFLNNVANTKLWSKLLATRYSDKDRNSHRRIGYCLPLTYMERMRYEEALKK